MEVIYCDNHILVVVKPAGCASQPHLGSDENLTDQAKDWIKKKFNKPGAVFLEAIHRLDKPVSGLVLFARTSKALSRLQESMRERTIIRIYYALVEGVPDLLQGTLEHHLVHDEHIARVVSSIHKEGKLARLAYRVIKENMLEITLETGRYHQIRVQLAAEGFPVLGDEKYGSKKSWRKNGIALHHGKMSFIHPVTKEALSFTSIPKDFPQSAQH